MQILVERLEEGSVAIHELLRGNPFLLCSLLNFDAMFICSNVKAYFIPTQSEPPCCHIR